MNIFYKPWDRKIILNGHEIAVRLFRPESEIIENVLVFFHGGGWVSGTIDSYNRPCYNLSKITNSLVISVDYRLAPEYKFPCGLEDCYAVTREVFLNHEIFGVPQDKIVVVGDSAGGNLAAAICLMAKDRGEFMPKNQILIYPATYNDHTESSPFLSIQENGYDYLLTSKRICDYLELYESDPSDRENPYFAPLLAEDLSGQPDTLIITAEFDPLRDEGEAYAKKLKDFNNSVFLYRIPDALHGFFKLPLRFTQVKQLYYYINAFLEREY